MKEKHIEATFRIEFHTKHSTRHHSQKQRTVHLLCYQRHSDGNKYDFATVQEKGQQHDLDASIQWHSLDSVLNLMNEKVEYGKKLEEITKNEGEDGRKFYSPDGTITFATLFAKLEEARNQVDSVK